MRKCFSSLIKYTFYLILGAVSISAQVTGGAVTGSVVDPNGAVVPNATITLTDKARGQVFTVQTTDAGSYLFPNVPVGEYTVSIAASGFGTVTRELAVTLNQTSTVDATLQAGSTNVTVDVVASSEAVVQTDTSQLGRNFDQRKVQDLPINGDPNNLAVLAPNVIPPANGTLGSGGVSGGVRARGNSFNVDGVDNNAPDVTGPATGPIQDAVEEFTLLQNNFNAEFGAGAGGQFNTITKSGTNQYRGNLFGYVGSQRFDARSTDEDGTDKNFFKQSRYGGTFGGPLPFFNFGEGGPLFHSGKNKLFFFGAYEKFYEEEASSSGSYFAPTLAGLNQLAAIPGVSPFVIDIFRNNVTLATTASIISGVTKDEDGNIIIPVTETRGVSGIEFGVVSLPVPAFTRTNQYQFNVDHLPNERNQFRYRYSRSNLVSEQAGSGGLEFNNNFVYDTDLFSFNYIRTFSSNLVNDLRLSFLRTVEDYPLINQSLSGFPNLTISSLNLAIGPGTNLPQNGYNTTYQVYDSVTLIQGGHTFKFGADYRRANSGGSFLPRARGDYSYSSFDLLLQDLQPDLVNIRGIGSGAFTADNHRIFAFAQDDWKIRPNLTLNLGVRYEYQGLFRDAALQETAANANVPGVIEFGVPQTDKNNFAPRIGFAYSPSFEGGIGGFLFGSQGESSIRGNFARAFFSNFSNLVSISLPPTLQGELQDAGSATNFLQNGGAGSAPFVPNLTPEFLRGNAGSYILDQIVPYTDSFTVSYQRQIGSNNGLEIRYLHTRSKRLPVQVQLNGAQTPDAAFVIPTFLNTPSASQLASLPDLDTVFANNPTSLTRPLEQYGFFGALTGFPNIGESRYNGLSASLTRRFTRNVGFTAAYTFSKTRDNSTNELFSSVLNPRRAQNSGTYFGPDGEFIGIEGLNLDDEYSDSVLDIPHRFVTSFNIDIPFFNNSENGFLRAVLGGFQVNGVFQIQSGQPITVLAGRDANLNGDSAGDRALFNPAGDPTISSGIIAIDRNGNTVPIGSGSTVAYVATNPDAGFISTGFLAREFVGNGQELQIAGRNSLRSRGFNNTDLVVLKNTRFGKDNRFNFQIGAEIFDLFNQRSRTIIGVGALTNAFNTAGNANFNNYNIGAFTGRTITLRAKFFF